MEIDSKPYGTIEIDESKTVTIKQGLFGFEGSQEYVIIGKKEEQPFEWLQSLDDSDLAFVIVQPHFIRSDYRLSLLPEDLEDVNADSAENLVTYVIVTIPDDPEDMTVNLKGPVIVNEQEYIGKQVINQVDEYTVRHRVVDEVESMSEEDMVGEGGSA
jgi:flagellar assembly factor FliW